MGEVTGIEWTDHTASPWHGCEHATLPDGEQHPGCLNCYAERQSLRNSGVLGVWGEDGTRVKSKSFINNLRRWNEQGKREGRKIKVFPSICDPFEDRPELAAWREEMFHVADECPWIILLLLTKRPQNIRRMLTPIKSHDNGEHYRRWPNVWLGTSVSDQDSANKTIPALLECRDLSPVLFLSAEPLLGPIDFEMIRDPDRFPGCAYFDVLRGRMIHEDDDYHWTTEPHVDWVIVGGESGPKARENNLAWTRTIVSQCQDADVPCFHKQIGALPVETIANEAGAFVTRQVYVNDRRHGANPDEWERALRVRQFPEVSP